MNHHRRTSANDDDGEGLSGVSIHVRHLCHIEFWLSELIRRGKLVPPVIPCVVYLQRVFREGLGHAHSSLYIIHRSVYMTS